MDRTVLPLSELKRMVVAEIDRRLGARGTIRDAFIEPDGDGWRIEELDADGDAAAIEAAARSAIPELQRKFALRPKGPEPL